MAKDPPKSLGERVKFARLKAGLTQVQLSQRSGVGQPSISSLESGESRWARGGNLLRLAAALGVSPQWLETGLEPLPGPEQEAEDWVGILAVLTPVNRRILREVAASLLASQGDPRPSVADPFPGVPLPRPIGKKATP